MENQYGQALNTHARFNAYASSPSIETSERIHNRRQAKLNYLCPHSHTYTHSGKCPFVACTAFILYNYIYRYMRVRMYVGTLGFDTPSIQVWARTQLRGKQKQQKQAKSRWSIKQQQYICVGLSVFVCVCLCWWAASVAETASVPQPARASERLFLCVCVCVFDLSLAWVRAWVFSASFAGVITCSAQVSHQPSGDKTCAPVAPTQVINSCQCCGPFIRVRLRAFHYRESSLKLITYYSSIRKSIYTCIYKDIYHPFYIYKGSQKIIILQGNIQGSFKRFVTVNKLREPKPAGVDKLDVSVGKRQNNAITGLAGLFNKNMSNFRPGT